MLNMTSTVKVQNQIDALIWCPLLTGIHLFDFRVMGHQLELARNLRRFEIVKTTAQARLG